MAVRALDGVDLSIAPGDFAVLMGASGSGKSTLLNLAGAIDQPSAGSVSIGDHLLEKMTEVELTRLRRTSIGFVFQFFHLIPTLTVEENIAFPLELNGVSRQEVKARVESVLAEVELTPRRSHFPNQLSGGEMQRVAIGRAVVNRPQLILADEPTGNLDSKTGEKILDLLRNVHRSYSPTIIMATHSDRASQIGDYIIRVSDGRITSRDVVR